MNAVQFGRWFSERRRSSGWPSQRLLAEAAQQHTITCQANLSEDFLSRLEAGHLAHPFRGTVRRRILLLAWLLCRAPRDLKAYLKAAGLNECSEEEHALLHLLNEHLTTRQTPPPLLLPARPGHLQGRVEELEQILHALSKPATPVFAITGMPGIGKSALAYESLHRLAAVESERPRHFPDGIATFTCTGRRDTRGLISLLHEIISLFTTGNHSAQEHTKKRRTRKHTSTSAHEVLEGERGSELASLIDRARAALANKRVLILLDDLDPAFPLRQVCDVLLTQGGQTLHEQRVILTTSQFVPSPALVSAHLHVQPLPEKDALALLSKLTGEELGSMSSLHARQACAAVGYLPLAIEGMATAIRAQSIPPDLVATYLSADPPGGFLASAAEIVARMEQALAHLAAHLRADYLLLAALELPAFDLETASAILTPQHPSEPGRDSRVPATLLPAEPASTVNEASRAATVTILAPPLTRSTAENEHTRLIHLARTAAILGQFVQLSLLEHVPGARSNNAHYHMHILLYHYARTLAHTLPGERLAAARQRLTDHPPRASNGKMSSQASTTPAM